MAAIAVSIATKPVSHVSIPFCRPIPKTIKLVFKIPPTSNGYIALALLCGGSASLPLLALGM